jgi:16S rRNA (cytidine1402-2'-O)-methyltransferase
LEALPRDGATHVFYEAPHRILDTLADVEAVFGAGLQIVVARELTKLHEEFLRGAVGELRAELEARVSVRGEIVLLMALDAVPAGQASAAKSIADEVAALVLSEGLSEMASLKKVAKERGLGKSEAYRELQREQSRLR